MAYTIRNSAENGGGGGSSTLTVTLSGTSVVAGDLVVVAAACASSGTVNQISDGTTNLTLLTADVNATDQVTIGYLLSSVATGLLTYTVTYSASVSQRECHVYVFNPAGASSSLDAERHDGLSASGTAVDSNAITTTGTDEAVVCFCYHDTGAAMTAKQINSVAFDGTLDPAGNMSSWYKIFTSTFTGNGTGTLPGATRWMAPIAAFKSSAGGGGAAAPVPLLGQACL
jgi:hypothetical protein